MKITNASGLKLLGPPMLAVVAAAVLLLGSSLVQTPEVAATGPYDRIEVSVGKTLQVFKVDEFSGLSTFTCQSTGETVAASFKDHVKDANGPGQHHEVWGATFSTKCITGGPGSGVNFTLDPVDPNNNLLIKECRFLNTDFLSVAEEDCTSNVSPNPGVGPGTQDFKVESKKVGGLVVDLDGELGDLPLETAQSSSSNAGVLAGTIAGLTALAVTLGGAAWYALRRWAR